MDRAEMEFALSQGVASGGAFEHRPSECGHCVQDFLAELDLHDLPGEAAGLEFWADGTHLPLRLRVTQADTPYAASGMSRLSRSEYLRWPPRDVRRGALHTL